MDTIHEVRPGSPTYSDVGLIHGMDRHKTCVEIAIQRLKLITLNISKIRIDLVEASDDNKLLFENSRLLQDLAAEINDIVAFIGNELARRR
jgi:hypothetical protein